MLDRSDDREDSRSRRPTALRLSRILSDPRGEKKSLGRGTKDAQYLRRCCGKLPGGWQWREKFSSLPRRAFFFFTPTSVTSNWFTERWCHGQAISRKKASWSPDVMGAWRRGGGGLERRGAGCVPRTLVGLSGLHLQQSQHGWVVAKFHPPLSGQAHVLSQVVHSSYTQTNRQRERKNRAHVSVHTDRWEIPETYVPFTLISFLWLGLK